MRVKCLMFLSRIHEKKSAEAKLNPILLDSGSLVNLLSIQTCNAIGLHKTNIQSCGKYNIKSSTDTVKDCILGSINVNIPLLLYYGCWILGWTTSESVWANVRNLGVNLTKASAILGHLCWSLAFQGCNLIVSSV